MAADYSGTDIGRRENFRDAAGIFAELVTGDPEFKAVAGIVPVDWL